MNKDKITAYELLKEEGAEGYPLYRGISFGTEKQEQG